MSRIAARRRKAAGIRHTLPNAGLSAEYVTEAQPPPAGETGTTLLGTLVREMDGRNRSHAIREWICQ